MIKKIITWIFIIFITPIIIIYIFIIYNKYKFPISNIYQNKNQTWIILLSKPCNFGWSKIYFSWYDKYDIKYEIIRQNLECKKTWPYTDIMDRITDYYVYPFDKNNPTTTRYIYKIKPWFFNIDADMISWIWSWDRLEKDIFFTYLNDNWDNITMSGWSWPE